MTDFIQQLDDKDVRVRLTEHINSISATQRRKLLSGLENRPHTIPRKYYRKNCHSVVDYAVSGRFFKDVAKNLSAGGAFIETGNSFSNGQEVTLCFSLNGTPVKTTGEIAWTGPVGIGVKFNRCGP